LWNASLTSQLSRDQARAALVRVLQDAHAGELAAAYAYRGHWQSRRREPAVRAEIKRIEGAEWHHRSLVANLLDELEARPRPAREALMWTVGRFFGLLCFVSFRFGPMYAAGRLEAANVGQYDNARGYADQLGLPHFVAELAAMCEEEVRHEVFFGEQCIGHPLLPLARLIGRWSPPEPAIRVGLRPAAPTRWASRCDRDR
jgi:demethoxyubiquinone hydroxylase (CLK1/Coq7/Cat5 family)